MPLSCHRMASLALDKQENSRQAKQAPDRWICCRRLQGIKNDAAAVAKYGVPHVLLQIRKSSTRSAGEFRQARQAPGRWTSRRRLQRIKNGAAAAAKYGVPHASL